MYAMAFLHGDKELSCDDKSVDNCLIIPLKMAT